MQASPSIVVCPIGGTQLFPQGPPTSTGRVQDRRHPRPARDPQPGRTSYYKAMKASFCWSKMGKDITAYAQSCLGCQCGKIHRHVSLQPKTFAVPHQWFSHIHVDFVGPLPKSAGNN
jgi:hypothetical protein